MPYDSDEFQRYVQGEIATPKRERSYWAALATPLAVGAAVGAAGFIPVGQGRLWDKYLSGLEHLEGLSPFGILRTFRLSEIFSPLATPKNLLYSPSEYSHLLSSPSFQRYISQITGLSVSRLEELQTFEKGLEWKRTGKVLGELRVLGGGPVLASNAGILSTGYGPGGGRIAEWFARVMGAGSPRSFSTVAKGEIFRAPKYVPIAHPKGAGHLAAQYTHAMASSAVGRLNLLLQSPFQHEALQNLVKKIPFLSKLRPGVKEGTALQMLGRYTVKAAGAYLAFHALKYNDYLQRKEGGVISLPRNVVVGGSLGFLASKGLPTRGRVWGTAIGAVAMGVAGLSPRFKHGFISGIADIYARGRIDLAKMTSPWRSGATQAEENFEGITKLPTLVAMAGSGLLLGGAYDYAKRLNVIRHVAASRKSRLARGREEPIRSVYEVAEAVVQEKRERVAATFAKAAKGSTGVQRMALQAKGVWKSAAPWKKGAVAGIGAFGALSGIGRIVSGDVLGGITTLAGFAGAGVAYAAGKATKNPWLKALAAVGIALPFLTGGQKGPEELRRIYSGEQPVEIKRGRAWEIGRSPWEGRRGYFRPHRLALLRHPTREAALTGSEENWWLTDPLAHPVEFFLDPYRREKMMWEQGYRFPVTQTPFEDFPILGPVLSATIGAFLKPPRKVARDQWLPPKPEEPAPPGYEVLPEEQPIMKTGIRGTIGEQIYKGTEMAGLPGFVLQSFKGHLTGRESWFPNRQYETPATVAGIEPSYWSLNIGGGLGMSELYRRFVPHRRQDVELYNPLPSGLPSWLPQGEGYFLDFSKAEVYSKIEEPWLRLPGPGFAQFNPEVKGVNPEDYSDFFRFKVLADVSPWSREYSHYARIMTAQANAGQLTPTQIIQVHEIREQVAKTKKRREFSERKYDMEQVRRERVKILSEVEPGVYLTDQFGKAPLRMAGVGTSGAELARMALQEDANITKAEALHRGDRKRAQMSDFLRKYVYPGAEVDVYVHREPGLELQRTAAGPVVPAVIMAGDINLNQEVMRRGLAERREEEGILDTIAIASGTQRGFGELWEGLMHGMETPLEVFTPAAPTAKFIHQRTALEDYLRSKVLSRDIAMWEHPISHFLAPGMKTTLWWAGLRGVPKDVQQRYMTQEYFDRLTYEKHKRLAIKANAAGEGEAAAAHWRKAARTRTGANPFSPMQAYLAIPKDERDYFRAFVEAPTREERREIARVVAPQTRRLLEAQWLRKETEAAEMRVEAGISTTQDQETIAGYGEAYQAAQAHPESGLPPEALPPPNFVGWHPAVDMRQVELKTVMDAGMDYHDYAYWPSDIKEVQRRPYIQSISQAFTGGGIGGGRIPISQVLQRYRLATRTEGSRAYDSYTPLPNNGIVMNITSPGLDRITRFLDDPTVDTL